MIFTSLEFLAFIAALVALLAATRDEGLRRWLLLGASYLFYAWWDVRFCLLLLGSSLVDYLVARRIVSSRSPRRWLLVSLVTNLGALAFFKYAGFFLDNLRALFDAAGQRLPIHLEILLPVGISFFTFQSMSYTIDVYRGRLEPRRNFRDVALFVAFFPQLVAGPIVRGAQFLPQLARAHPIVWENVRAGTERFAVGFVKKAIVADRLAIYVDRVFERPELYSTATCWLALIAFALQIYYDFSGYSDMAIGVGRALGFEFPENFRYPYLARDVVDFWRRWHITLSRWLRDYLYIPLGGNRRGRLRTDLNVMLTMLLGGLWHGASWNFVIWGGLHGAALVVARRFSLRSLFGTQLFVTLCWVFFRAPDLPTAGSYLRRLSGAAGPGIDWFYTHAVAIAALAVLWHLVVALRGERAWRPRLRGPVAWALAIAGLVAALYLLPGEPEPFLYFRF